ncbi:MAG TPA: hypothetical protein VF579_14810, partial [Candidatus Methylomirabilis sp.]
SSAGDGVAIIPRCVVSPWAFPVKSLNARESSTHPEHAVFLGCGQGERLTPRKREAPPPSAAIFSLGGAITSSFPHHFHALPFSEIMLVLHNAIVA